MPRRRRPLCRGAAILTLLVACVVILGAAAGQASGAVVINTTLRFAESDVALQSWSEVTVQAGPENNDLSLSATPGSVTIRDPSAPFTVNPPTPRTFPYELYTAPECTMIDPHQVSCPVKSSASRVLPEIRVDAGAGADRLAVSQDRPAAAIRAFASLGPGADAGSLGTAGELRGGPGRDTLTITGRSRLDPSSALRGDGGDDSLSGAGGNMRALPGDEVSLELSGGSGNDVLRGSPGPDALSPGPGRDRVDGRAGRDTLVYDGRPAVHVDVGRGLASSSQGRTRFRSVENLATGRGNDVLIGDADANQLVGGRGRNTIHAGAGDDTVADLAPGSTCGPGDDTVAVPTLEELSNSYDDTGALLGPPSAVELRAPAPSDCERARVGFAVELSTRPGVTARHVRFVHVRGTGRGGPGSVRWELRSGWRRGGRLLATRTTPDRRSQVTLRLNARGRACVARPDCRGSLTVVHPQLYPAELGTSAPLPLVLAVEET